MLSQIHASARTIVGMSAMTKPRILCFFPNDFQLKIPDSMTTRRLTEQTLMTKIHALAPGSTPSNAIRESIQMKPKNGTVTNTIARPKMRWSITDFMKTYGRTKRECLHE